MDERTKLACLLGAVGALLIVGFVFSIRLTVQIDHAAQAQYAPATQQAAPKHG